MPTRSFSRKDERYQRSCTPLPGEWSHRPRWSPAKDKSYGQFAGPTTIIREPRRLRRHWEIGSQVASRLRATVGRGRVPFNRLFAEHANGRNRLCLLALKLSDSGRFKPHQWAAALSVLYMHRMEYRRFAASNGRIHGPTAWWLLASSSICSIRPNDMVKLEDTADWRHPQTLWQDASIMGIWLEKGGTFIEASSW